MRKAIARVAVIATTFAAPMLASGTAHASELNLPDVGETITVEAIDANALLAKALGGGCITTYESKVLGTGIGQLVTINGYNVTIGGNAVMAYTWAQAGHAVWLVNCLY